jgi:uncharacterized protein
VRIFLDANILFSAALSAGAMRRLIRDLQAAGHALVADGFVWEEARRNLMLKNSAAVAELHVLVSLLELHTGLAGRMDVSDPEVPGLPEKDRPVVSAAAGLGCTALITVDRRYFGAFFGHAPRGIRILSPMMAAEELL